MAIDVLITPASGTIYISGSEAQTPTPPNLTNGTNYLWASGSTLQWGNQEVYTNAPGSSEITGGGSANQVAYYSASTTITGSANLTYDGTDLTIARTADNTSRGISIQDNEGTETIRLGTSTSDHGLFYLRGATGGNAIYLDGGAGTNYLNAGDVGIGNTTAIGSAKLTVKDASDPQLTLAYDGSMYTTFKTDSAGDLEINLTSGGTFNFGQSLGNEYFKFLRGNGSGIFKIRDNGNFYFDGANVIHETTALNYFQLKGENFLGFGSGADFSMSASGNVFYMMSGTTNPNTTPILGIKQNGAVGIGTNNPPARLSIPGDGTKEEGLMMSGDDGTNYLSLYVDDANPTRYFKLQHNSSYGGIQILDSAGNRDGYFFADATGPGLAASNGYTGLQVNAGTGGSAANTITTIYGNTGIGTVAPDVKLDVRGDTNVSGTLGVTANVDVGNRVRYKAGTTKFLDFTGDGATSITMSGFQAFRPGTSGNAAGNGQDLGTTSFPWDKIYSQGLTLSNQTGGDSSPGAKTIWVSGSDVYWGTSKLNAQSGGGGGSVAGSDTQVQFNDGGAFGADAGLTYAKATDTLTAGAYNLENLDDQLTWAGRNDLLIQGTTSYDMELISPQDMAFSIDSDNNETAHKYLFRTNSKTPSTSGTNLMSILETGRVGVNTASPQYSFDVRGTASFRDEGSSSQRLLMYGQNDHFTLNVTGSSHRLAIQTGGPGVVFQDASANDHLTIRPTGTNGAQVSSSAALYISGQALTQLRSGTDSVYIAAAEHNYFDVGTRDTYSHIFRDGTGEFARFKNARLGIGTVAPQQPIHVLTSSNDTGILIDVSDDSHEGRLLFGDTSSNAVGHIGYNHSLEAMRFFVNSTEQLRITDNVITLGDGVVLAPDASDNFTIDSPNGIILDGTSAANGVQYHDGGAELLRISNSSSNPIIRIMQDSKDLIFQQYDAAEVMRIGDDKKVRIGDSSATVNHLIVERDPTDTTYTILHGKAKYPRIRFEDTQASATQDIWHLGNQLRFGTNAGSSTTSAMYVQNGQPSDGLNYGTVTMNSGVMMGTTSPINSARLSIVDTTRPLLLGYDGSNYVNFNVGSSGQLTIDAGNDINLDAHSGLFNFKDGGTEFFRIAEDTNSNTVLQAKVDAKDIIFKQYDNEEVMRLTDSKTLDLPSNNAITFDNSNDNNQWFISNRGTNAATLVFGIGNVDNSNAKITMDGDGDLGIGTTTPSTKLFVTTADELIATFESTDDTARIRLLDNDTSNYLVSAGDTFSLGSQTTVNTANVNISAVGHIGVGNTAPTFGIDVSGASTRTAMANVPYIFDVHAGFQLQAAIQPNAGNIAMIAPDAGTPAAGLTIPVQLPASSAVTTGLEITVVQDTANDPGAALAVQAAQGTSDVIYEGGSNSASSTVSIAANRGANKTFINVASGVWVAKT